MHGLEHIGSGLEITEDKKGVQPNHTQLNPDSPNIAFWRRQGWLSPAVADRIDALADEPEPVEQTELGSDVEHFIKDAVDPDELPQSVARRGVA